MNFLEWIGLLTIAYIVGLTVSAVVLAWVTRGAPDVDEWEPDELPRW
jgi:hypothetical protein